MNKMLSNQDHPYNSDFIFFFFFTLFLKVVSNFHRLHRQSIFKYITSMYDVLVYVSIIILLHQ